MSMNCLSYELYWNTLSRNMNPVATQQVALDNSLVAPEKRLKIERSLKLSPCYPAFVITSDVPEIYMHQFWTTIKKIRNSDAYNFKLEKKKFQVDTEVFREILQICPRILNQDFVAPPLEEEFVTFIQELVKKKARKYKKVASPLRKLSPVKEAEPIKKGKRVKRLAKKSITAPTAGVAIRDTPGVSVSKKKAPAKADKSDGTDFESRVPDEQQCKTSGTDEGTGTKLGVPDIPTYDFKSENESWGDSDEDNDDDSDDDIKGNDDKADSDDDVNSDADNNERTDLDDDDENPSFTLKEYDEEEHEEEYKSDDDYENMFKKEDDDLYKDVNVRSLGAEHERETTGDEEMTNADQNFSREKSYDSKQSSSVSSDFASKFLILENVSPAVDEVASMMKSRQEESSTQAPSLFTVPETVIPETATTHAITVPPTISMISPLPQLMTLTPAPITASTTTSIPALPDFSSLFGFDQRVSTLETEMSQLK
ncbi:hypothetical protein Tco_0475590 [Tanacetum coccineum]